MLKKIIFLLIIAVFIFNLSSCYNNDDWAPYTKYSKELNISIRFNETKISDILPQLTKIAQKYEARIKLTQVILFFNGMEQINTKKGEIEFIYFKSNDNPKINQVCMIKLYYNMDKEIVYKMDYKKGHGKRVNYFFEPIDNKYIDMPITEIFKQFSNNLEYSKLSIIKNEKLLIELIEDRMSARLTDGKENSTFSFNFES